MFRTHRMFVILLCLIVYMNSYGWFNYFGLSGISSFQFLVFIIVAIIASMMPDIDNPSSKIGRNIKIVGYMFNHRGCFHSLPAMLLFTIIVAQFVSMLNTFAFFLGYISHLGLDTLNRQGIYWLYPLKYKVKGVVKTNGLLEKALFYCCIVFVLALLLRFL